MHSVSGRCVGYGAGGSDRSHLHKRRGEDENASTVKRLLQCQITKCEYIHSRNSNTVFNLPRITLAIPHGVPHPAYPCRPRRGSTKLNSAPALAQRSARGRRRTTKPDTLILSSSRTAVPERPTAPQTRALSAAKPAQTTTWQPRISPSPE
ncbi:hypothetical protein CDCA_CDCA16G4114 [Cyanidium caldarium]|uniref:Uncharacterized protein n=1 Tax=Cyanidium caldarium TaxID=2771 RepID=A0AAV9J0L8_CYACA|nr:hypothetical protein CDCA_CDCA16G4114 [Cyanidium caldarium]